MQVSKVASSITSLFASLDVHYISLNTEVQKQNETLIRIIKQKLLNQ